MGGCKEGRSCAIDRAGVGDIPGEVVPHPSAINVAATPLHVTPRGRPLAWVSLHVMPGGEVADSL